jgi:hypothetical protein
VIYVVILGGSVGMAQTSPRFGDSVYVLLLNDHPIGSAFVISYNRLCTTAHHFHDEKTGITTVDGFSIVLRLVRHHTPGKNLNNSIIILKEPHLIVQVVDMNIDEDWAILEVVDVCHRFNQEDILTICPQNEIPSSRTEPDFKMYHCRVQEFLDGDFDILESVAGIGKMKAISCGRDVMHMTLPIGYVKGASGGAVIIANTKQVIAMHLSSTSSFKAPPDISEGKRLKVNDVWESISSGSNSHSSNSRELILSFCNLERFVNY